MTKYIVEELAPMWVKFRHVVEADDEADAIEALKRSDPVTTLDHTITDAVEDVAYQTLEVAGVYEEDPLPYGHDLPGRIIARFVPQASVRDQAMEVDAEGPVLFDVTEDVLALENWQQLHDDTADVEDLRSAKRAPAWIRDWPGPFYISVAQSVEDYIEHMEEQGT